MSTIGVGLGTDHDSGTLSCAASECNHNPRMGEKHRSDLLFTGARTLRGARHGSLSFTVAARHYHAQ